MHFQKEDMLGNDYEWKEEEKHLFSGMPSRRIFDRFNGNQVLFIINFLGSLSERFTIGEANKVEYKIRNDLPLQVKSEISVINWIKNTDLSPK